MRFQKKRLQQYLAICILTFGFLNTFLVNRANAQSVSQVQIVGIPPVAKTPYLNSLKKNFEAGLYRVQFLYSSPSMQPKNFKFKVSLTRDGNSILDLTSNPKQFSPGMHTFTSFFEDISFPQSVSDILSGIDSQLKKQVLQEGTIPEGTYRLEIKAIPATQTTGVSVVPGISSFSVRLPNPPILITPSDGSNVTQAIPTFAWTPVTTGLPGSLEYHLLIVEVLSGQTPLQAINGNRPMADHVLNNVTTYSYTPDNLPLEKGHKYAWQITAKDPNGDIPIKDNGQSEIHTFVFGQSKSDNNQVAGSLKDLKNITLIPGFAKLTGVQGLSAQEQGNTYVLSGQANLELTVSTSSKPYEATVAVNRLVIQKGSILHPVILGGAISASNVPLPVSLKSHKSTVRLKQLKWQLGQSVTVSADLVGPDGKKYPGKGKLTWSKNGLSGTITAKGSRQNPIMTFGKNPFQMYVTGFRMTFPGGQMVASGEVDLFNGETVFNLPSIGLDQDTVFANVTGTVKKPIYPVPNSQIMRIDLNSANGSFAFSRKTGKGHYDVQFQGSVGFLEGPNHYCGADALMQMSSANGFSIKNVNPNCDLSHPGIDLAGLKMKFTNPSIPLLSYDSSSDKWNFKFKMDALLDFPALNGFQLPKLKGVTISPGGIEFPKLTLSQSTLQSIPAFSIGKFKMNLTAFHMPHFTFPAFGSKDEKSKGWKFDMNFKMHWPKKGLGKLPPCLLDKDLTVKHAGLKNGAISGSIDAQVLDSCRVPLGPDYALILENLSGKVGIKLSTNPSVTSQLKLQASLEMGDPFNCDNQNGPMSLGNTDLTLHSDGHITGTVKNLVPKCPLNVGPYQATVKTAELDLTDTNGNQGAVLSTTATLHLGDHQSVDGVAAVDLTTGKFSKLSFDMNKPFDWSVPKKNPVFVFHINKAHIGLDGLKIDGRQKLKLQNSSTDVTFDHMVLNLNTMRLKSGKVIIDQGVGFKSGIDASDNMTFRAVSDTTTLGSKAGLMMALQSAIVIDTAGAHVKGEADATLHFNKWKLDTLKATFNQNFALGFSPFGIKRGQINFDWKDQRIAYADNSGFHPDPSFFGNKLLPDKIPLPVTSIAYLQIKQNDTLLVTAKQQQNGTYLLNTKPGAKLKLVMPAFKGNLPNNPELDVTLQNVHINPSTAQIQSGTVIADVPANDTTFNLSRLGVPMYLTRVAYGTNADPNLPSNALILDGKLTIFHHPFNDQSGSVTAEIAQNGYLSANVDLENLDENVPLDGDANRTSLVLNTVKGNINTNVNGAVQPSYNFNLDGTFQINDLNGNPAAHTGIQAQLNQNEMTVSVTQANALNQPAKINLGSLKLGIQQIQNLSLNWSSRLGLSYDVDMDLNLTMDLDSGQDFKAPLKNVELKSDVGIIIPQQDINDNSNPPLQSPGFDVGAFHLKPIAFHVKKDTIHFFTFQSGDLVHLIPHADFELTFPGFKNTLPQLQHTTATLNNVGFNNGILDGTLEPLTIPNGGILVPLSAHTGLKVQKISGSLGAANDGSQNYDIHISGKLKEPDFFTSKNQNCPDKTFSVQLNKEGGLTGTVHNFTPCGQLVMGPVSLGFSNTELDFGFSNNKQTLTMEGDASATLKTDNTTPLTATGNLKLDILQGEVLSGNINLQGPFTFYYPSRDSIFQFTVQHAQINNNGFVLTGNGSLDADGKSVNVAFNNAAFDLVGGSISTGSIQIQDQIGLEVGLDPTKWSLVDPSQPISVNKGLRFVLPQNISIDKNGVNINGTSTVAMRYGKHNGDNYQVQFHNLLLGLSPVGVTSGRADIDRTQQNGQSERIAFYDNKGFHLDNVLAAVNVPDTLGLPSKDIAYLVLRDPATKTLKVKTQNTPNGGLRLTTKSGQKVKMVLVGFNKSLNIQLDVEVNNTFSKITGGSIKAVPTNPIDLKQALHIPLAIDTVKFEQPKGQNLFKLLASVSIKLPDALNNIPLSINNVAIGKSGFKNASISAGTIWQDDSNVPTKPVAKPLISKSFADSNFVMAIDGAKIQLGNSKKVQLSGEFYSKLLVDHSTKKMQHLFYTAGYSVSNNKWSFSSNASDLVNQLGLGNKYLRLNMDQLSLESGSNNFGVDIDGRISSPDILGQGFAVTVKDLKIGTNGVSIGSVGTNNSNTQTVSLLNGKATIKQPSLNVTYQNDLLSLVLSGQLNFLGKQFDINDLSIRSDGHVSMGNGSVELIGQNKSYNIIGSYVQLTSLKVIVDNSAGLKLQAQGKAKLPDVIAENADPGSQTSSTFTVTVDKNGHITSQGPDFDTSGKLANLSLGDIATINLTGAGMHLNLTDMAQSIFYVDANLFIDKDPGSKGNTNKIQFGVPNNNNNNSEDVSNYGFYYQNGNVNWNISNTPSFSFNTSFFKLSLQNVSTGTAANNHNSGFNLKMNLGANLKLKGFTSSITLKDMEINKAGISDFGHINSGSLSLGSKITISIGQFSHGSNTDIHIAKASGSADKSIGKSDTTIHVQEYLRFGSESGTPALHINIADLPKASVQEVLYYKTNNSLRLTVKDATVGFGNYINLKAGFDYHYTDSDNWILKVAASGHFNFSSSGGSGSSGSGTGFDALGKLGKVDGDFTFGVYFQLDASIPIVPPRLIVANSIGGGFFYNGTNDDIHHVMHDVMHYKSDIGGNEPWKGQGSHKYIVMFEAKVDVIKLPDNIPGTSVDSYVQGSMFLVATDQSFFLDVKATYFGMKQGNDPELYGDLSLSYKDSGNGKWSFNATGSVHANFHSVVTGKAQINFDLEKNPGKDPKWALTGNGNLHILKKLASAQGNLVLTKKAFWLKLNASGGFDVSIISINSSFATKVWWIPDPENIGAYVKFGITASVFDGAASLSADAQGALLKQKNYYLLYASAEGKVHIAYVYDGKLQVWVSLDNSGFDGGLGSNDKYDKLIAKAEKQAKDMANGIKKTMAAVKNAKGTTAAMKVSPHSLARSGAGLLMESRGKQSNDVSQMLQKERTYMSAFRPSNSTLAPAFYTEASIIKTRADYVRAGDKGKTSANNLRTDMNHEINALGVLVPIVRNRLQKAKSLSLTLQKENTQLLTHIASPIQTMEFQWKGSKNNPTQPPSFRLKPGQDKKNVQNLSTVKANVDAMNQRFKVAIRKVRRNISKVDEIIAGKTNDYGGGLEHFNWGLSSISVNYLANQYTKTERAIAKYYAQSINNKWIRYYWSSSLLQQFHQNKSALFSAINNMTPSSSIQPNGTVDEALKKVTRQRMQLLGQFDPTENYKKSISRANDMTNKLNSENVASQIADFDTTAHYIWYEMFTDTLGSMKIAVHHNIDTMRNYYNQHMAAVQANHQQFTKLLDQVYSTKAKMVGTLHALVDTYARWLKSAKGDSAAAPVEQQRQQIEKILASPKIGYLRATARQNYYMNHLSVRWNSSHPTGEIIENSILLSHNTGNNVYGFNLMTVGDNDQYDTYFVKQNDQDNVKNLKFILRARGPAGNTISRSTNVQINVDDHGHFSGDYYIPAKSFHASKDNTPPGKPYVTFPYNSHSHMKSTLKLIKGANGRVVGSKGSLKKVTSYYTSVNSKIKMKVTASDKESDIAGIQYRLGNTSGGSSLRGWTNAFGQREYSGNNTSGIDNMKQDITIRGLNMTSGTPYYVSVRAMNGDSLYSQSRNVTESIIYDATPPGIPKKAYVYHYQTQVYIPGTNNAPVAVDPTQETPDMEQPTGQNIHEITPKYTIQWRAASDPESGIHSYQYTVTTDPDTSGVFSDLSKVNSTTNKVVHLTGDPLTYTDTLYAYVRAKNNAGSYGKSLRIGPFVVKDGTSPTKPKVTVKVMPADMTLYVLQPSLDLESGIKKQEYAIGKNNTTDISVRDWTDATHQSGLVNIYRRVAQGKQSWPGRVRAIPVTLSRSNLPTGVKLYIHYRTINSQGKISSQSVTGPIVLDQTPPDVPTLKLNYPGNNKITINANGLHDGQSGIRKVEYKVRTTGTNFSTEWRTLRSYHGVLNANRTYNDSKTISDPYPRYTSKVGIRVTNGNGEQTVVWSQPRPLESRNLQVNPNVKFNP